MEKVMDTNLGRTFRRLRKFKNMEIKEVASEDISYAQISKFERGKTDMTLTKFLSSLKAINVSLEEFYHEAYFSNLSKGPLFNYDFCQKFEIDDKEKLHQLLKIETDLLTLHPSIKCHKLNIIHIKSQLHLIDPNIQVNKKDTLYLKEYLLSINKFCAYELYLYSSCLSLLDYKTQEQLIQKIISAEDEYLDFISPKILKIILRLIPIFIENNFLDSLPLLFTYLESHTKSDLFFYEKVTTVYLKALYELKINPENHEASSLLNSYSEVFKLFNSLETEH